MGIEQYLQQILSARYGKDVRQSIHDSIYEINETAKKAEYDASTAPESAKAYAQAALASEQAAEDYKTAAEQAAQQAMSGTPEGYADLVAKVNSIYRQTATSYNVVGTSEGSALARTIYGMSVQDGTPTPSVPVEIKSAKADFRCTGKNLIPYPYYRQSGYSSQGMTGTYGDDGIITINKEAGSATAHFNLYAGYKLLIPNTRYKLSMSLENTNSASVYISVNNIDIAAIRNKASGNYEYAFTTPNELLGQTSMGIYFGADDVETNCKVKVMLTLADVDQTYEVNKHKDIITDLNLRAIEVASTDDYTYVRDGKYYIADTLDWSEDRGYEITRRIKEITINNIPSIGSLPRYGMISTNTINPNEFKLPSSQNIRPNAVMTHFATATIQELLNNDGRFYFNPTSGGHVFIRNDNMTSLADWNAWLSENTVVFQGILITPTTESITSEQAQALLSLKTYDEATSISATGDIEPSLNLEYSKDRNTALALTGHNLAHKNALKLNDINTALIELGGN